MSYDLKIAGEDITIGANGDLQIVENEEKLIQDILKILFTPLNGNIFFPWYGSPLTKSLIGQVFEFQFIASIATNQLRNALEIIRDLQEQQISEEQFVSASEQIAAIENVEVEQNIVDPRRYRIFVRILNKAFVSVNTNFQVVI